MEMSYICADTRSPTIPGNLGTNSTEPLCNRNYCNAVIETSYHWPHELPFHVRRNSLGVAELIQIRCCTLVVVADVLNHPKFVGATSILKAELVGLLENVCARAAFST